MLVMHGIRWVLLLYFVAERIKASNPPFIRSITVTVGGSQSIFSNAGPSQPVFTLGPGMPVTIEIRAADPDANTAINNAGTIIHILNVARGALLAQSTEKLNYLIDNPSQLGPDACAGSTDSYCLSRAEYLCMEVSSNRRVTDSSGGKGCQYWPSMDPGNTTSVVQATIGGKSFSNQTTFSYQFAYNTSIASMIDVPNPFRQVCVAILSPSDQVGKTDNGPTACFLFRFEVPPAPLNCQTLIQGFTLLIDPIQDPLSACGARSLLDTKLAHDPVDCGFVDEVWCQWPVTIAIGQSFRGKIYFRSRNVSSTPDQSDLSIALLSSPGLPNGATIGPTVLENVALYKDDPNNIVLFPVFSREIRMTPGVADLQSSSGNKDALMRGIQYQICFGVTPSISGLCASIRVVRPEPQVLLSLSNFPLAQSCIDSGACDESFGMANEIIACGSLEYQTRLLLASGQVICKPTAEVYNFWIRCYYQWTIYLYDARSAQEIRSGLHYSHYAPILVEDPENPLPPGVGLSAPEFEEKTFDVMNEAFPRRLVKQKIVWRPIQGMEGQFFRICLLLQDRNVKIGSRRVCSAQLYVQKCEACTRQGDTLNSLAAEFNTDWLQLWGANGNISNPNLINTTETPKIKLGPLYRAGNGDTIDIIANTFKVPQSAIIDMNPDLDLTGQPSEKIAPNQLVCLVPSLACATINPWGTA